MKKEIEKIKISKKEIEANVKNEIKLKMKKRKKKTMNILGIDCGMKGALTVMSPDGDIIEKYDMPKLNKKIDLYALRDIIKEHKDCFATVEENRCIGIGSKKSMFQFGMNYAYVIMAPNLF